MMALMMASELELGKGDTLEILVGCFVCRAFSKSSILSYEICEMCKSPDMLPTPTKAPNGLSALTSPSTISPLDNFHHHLLLHHCLAMRDHQFVGLLIDFKKVERKFHANHVFSRHHARQMRSWQKGSQAVHQNNGTTAIDTDNRRHKDLLHLLQFGHFVPGLEILNATNAQHPLTILVGILLSAIKAASSNGM